MYRTIQIGGHTPAQGIFLSSLGDGRIEIDAGHARLSGHPVTSLGLRTAGNFHGTLRKALEGGHLRSGILAAVAAFGLTFTGAAPVMAQDSVEILNVS